MVAPDGHRTLIKPKCVFQITQTQISPWRDTHLWVTHTQNLLSRVSRTSVNLNPPTGLWKPSRRLRPDGEHPGNTSCTHYGWLWAEPDSQHALILRGRWTMRRRAQRSWPSRRWTCRRCRPGPTWTRPWYRSYCRACRCSPRRGGSSDLVLSHLKCLCCLGTFSKISPPASPRPPNPIEYLAAFLLKNKSQFDDRS